MCKIIEKLKNVPNEYRPAPFWSWNGKLEKRELLRQIGDLREKGFGGFVIHARAGLNTPYMGDEWFDCVEACVNEAERRGMYVWLYDENGWPSGFAGGALLANEEFLVSGVKHREAAEWDSSATAAFLFENGAFRRVFRPETGAHAYVYVYTYKNHSYVDLCNGEVTKQFIEKTHEKYYARFSAHFGKTIKGFFTDEPQWFRGDTPYSSMLVPYFKEKYGEDVLEKLPLLFYEADGFEEFRFRYYSALNEMIRDNYFKKIYDWCETHGCELTGHAIDERSYTGQMICSGNVMPFYEYMQQPGMDFLGRFSSGARIAKQVYSVAKQTGRKRVLTEIFAMTGWDVTFEELKWTLQPQLAGGANFICPHLYPYAFARGTRYDHPCMFSRVDPWWEKFGAFNEYCARMCALLSLGTERTKIAVLHTVKSAYLHWNIAEKYDSIANEEEGMDETLKTLFSSGVPFDIVDESLLMREGKAENGKLCAGRCRYDALILPYCTAMNEETAALITEFIQKGGKVLAQYPSSVRVNGSERTGIFQSNVSFEELIGRSEVSFTQPAEQLVSTLRRTADGEKFLFIANLDKYLPHKAGVRIRGMESAELLDVLTLRRRPVSVFGETVYFTVPAAGGEVLLVNSREAGARESGGEKNVCGTENICGAGNVCGAESEDKFLAFEVVPKYAFPEENYLIADEAEWSLDGVRYKKKENVLKIQRELLRRRANGKVYLRHTIEAARLPESVLASVEYRPEKLLVNGETARVYRDGEAYIAEIGKLLRSGKNEIVIVSEFFQRAEVYEVLFGADTTESLLNCLRYDTELTELTLKGRFAVSAKKIVRAEGLYRAKGFILEKAEKFPNTGNTPPNGLPFYRGTLDYTAEVEANSGAGEYEIKLCGRFATAEISVNGAEYADLVCERSAAVRLREGKNTISVRIYSGNRNFYGPFHLAAEDHLVSPDLFAGGTGEYEASRCDERHYYFAPFGLLKIKGDRKKGGR